VKTSLIQIKIYRINLYSHLGSITIHAPACIGKIAEKGPVGRADEVRDAE